MHFMKNHSAFVCYEVAYLLQVMAHMARAMGTTFTGAQKFLIKN